MMKQCQHCNQEFTPKRCNQKYCNGRLCQKSRKRKWQRQKLRTDADYRVNQRDAQKRWRETHTDYWKKYRASHPGYERHNRRMQQKRNARRSGKNLDDGVKKIAKMDSKVSDLSGTYYLFPAASCTELPGVIAKMDAKLVQIQPVTESWQEKV
jgi:hypothetical protein